MPSISRIIVCFLLVLLSSAIIHSAKAQDYGIKRSVLVKYLRDEAQPPSGYVLSKFKNHRIVILGEHHWIKHDVDLVLDLIPRLKSSGVTGIGVEMFRASDQETIDRVINSERWEPAIAMAVMRTASWPYREYFEIIHAVWKANQTLPATERLHLLALGPETNWRERLLPLGQTYDTFMAQTVKSYLSAPNRRILIYCGAHHAFTRYYQPELPRAQRVEQFMNRMGNVLWRDFGEDVFTITLHRPWQCRAGEKWTRCLPLNGTIDCAAATVGHPVGFDVLRSPFARIPIAQESLYALGYPMLRLGDMTDGYIWTMPIEAYRAVNVLPLLEFAPDQTSLEYVSKNNPFSDTTGLTRVELESLAATESARLRDLVKSSGWTNLVGWQQRCKN